jgi:hypothetical protein
MRPCPHCGSVEWFVSSPPYDHSPAQLSHYCPRTGSRLSRAAETPDEHEAGEQSKAASAANARGQR